MPEVEMKFSGWQAVVAIIVVAALMGARVMSFSDQRGDQELMKDLEIQIMSDYLPEYVDRLKADYATGESEKIAQMAESFTTHQVNVEEVKISSPLLDFSAPRDVVVKVTYSLTDSAGTLERKTVYFLYSHGGLANRWSYQYETSAISYYLNLL